MSGSHESPLAEIARTLLDPLSERGSEPRRSALEAFAGLARVARDIAGETRLPAEKRVAMLDGLEALLDGRKPDVPLALPASAAARDCAEALRAAGLEPTLARHLLQAWRQDCAKPGFRDWADWMLFARFAAAPFGRLWAEAAGEGKTVFPAAEALACALLLCLHLQDAAEDGRRREKIYLPERWFRDRDARPADLAAKAAAMPDIRHAWRALYAEDAARGLAQLLSAAAPLRRQLAQRRLRKAAAYALVLTRRWAARLTAGDPWSGPVLLSGLDRLHARLAATLTR